MKYKALFKKLFSSFFIIFCIVTINFLLIRFMPGDPVIHIIGEDDYFLYQTSNPEIIEEIRESYGLNGSLWEQYVTYLTKTASLDFGNSFRNKAPVLETVSFRLMWTLALAIPATIIAAILGGILGLYSGFKHGGKIDNALFPIMTLLQTLPSNCLAIAFLLIFAFNMRLFPISGITSGGLHGLEKTVDILWHMVLPLSVLIILKTSSNYMLMKSTVLGIRNEEYITVAYSRGMTTGEIIRKELLKNAMVPYITSLCMQFGHIISGSMMIEVVFGWKGMGTLIYDSVTGKDFPMLQTCFLFIGICIIIFSFLADVAVTMIDPRIKDGVRYEG